MNPCACGYSGERSGRCRCTVEQIRRYQNRLSGPLLDRVDLHVRMQSVDPTELHVRKPSSESSAEVKNRVCAARERQLARSRKINAHLTQSELQQVARLSEEAQRFVTEAARQLGFSARGHHRVLRVARTIADLEDVAAVTADHLAEALQYRKPDPGEPGVA